MATVVGERVRDRIAFIVDSAAADIEEWNPEPANQVLEIISVNVHCENVIPSTFSIQDDDNNHFINKMAVSRGHPIELGPFPNNARPQFDGLTVDTPTFGTGPVSYCVVYRLLNEV